MKSVQGAGGAERMNFYPKLKGQLTSIRTSSYLRIIGLVVFASIYIILPNARPDLTRLNASDSEIYLSLSFAMTHGLGYTRSLVPGVYIPHTTWPPGFPLLLAPVIAFGYLPIDWLVIKIYMIVIGLTGILVAWIYTKRLTASIEAADVAAVLLGLLPFYWLFSRMAMSDGPAAVFILLALTLIDLVWAKRHPHASQVVIVGFISGLGMLLRGTNLCLVAVPLAYLVGKRRALADRLQSVILLGLFGFAFCIPMSLWAWRNASIDKSGLGIDGLDQFRMLLSSDWTNPDSLYATGAFFQKSFENFLWYSIYRIPEQLIPGLWNFEWWNWPGSPFIAMGLSIILVAAALPRHSNGLPLALTIAPYGAFLSFVPRMGAIRYWVPVTSLLIVLLVVNCSSVSRHVACRVRLQLIFGLIVAYIVNLAVFAYRFEAHPYLNDLGDMVALFDRVGSPQSSPPPTVHTDHPALFTLETGLPAPITVAPRAIEPRYTHLIVREAGSEVGSVLRHLPGAILLLSQGRWRYYALPKPMTEHELNSAEDHFHGSATAPP